MSNAGEITLRGLALHAGCETRVTLRRREGPFAIAQGAHEAKLDELEVVRADRGVTLAGRGVRVDLVEHLLAATAALGIRRDLLVVVDGPELPLLDGGSAAWFDALAELAIPSEPPTLVVTKAATLRHGESVYVFEPAAEVFVEAAIDFDHPLIGKQAASFRGDRADFRERIAVARTFGFLREAAALRAAGRAHGVDPRAVVVLTDEDVLEASLPLRENEAAHHKLLDLIGDLALYGGPPRGKVFASRPGHAATHRILREAFAASVVARAPRPR